MNPVRGQETKSNSIRTFALICVAVTSAFLIYCCYWLITLLSSQGWCRRAMGAVAETDGRAEFAVGGCFRLLHDQVGALTVSLYMALGSLSLCLLVLMVIVVAGGRLSFTASAKGVSGSMQSDESDSELPEPDQSVLASADEVTAKPVQPEGGKGYE